MQGIYCIRNIANNKMYIGSTKNFKKRWGEHRYTLHSNKHRNKHLQDSWNMYGEQLFKFEVLEEISDSLKLQEREQYWVDLKKSYSREYGYNESICVDNPMRGRHHTPETKEKLRLYRLGLKSSMESRKKLSASLKLYYSKHKHHDYGIKKTKEFRDKISKIIKGSNNPNWKGGITFNKKTYRNTLYLKHKSKTHLFCTDCGNEITEQSKSHLCSFCVKKGTRNPNYGKRGIESPIYGRKHTPEEMQKMMGTNNPSWKGGISFDKKLYNREWKRKRKLLINGGNI